MTNPINEKFQYLDTNLAAHRLNPQNWIIVAEAHQRTCNATQYQHVQKSKKQANEVLSHRKYDPIKGPTEKQIVRRRQVLKKM